MQKLSSILIASILVAGALAVMPIDNAYAGHIVNANTVGSAVTGLAISDDGTITDIDDGTVTFGEQVTIIAGDATGTNVFTALFVDVEDTDGVGADGIGSQIVLRIETETEGTNQAVAWLRGDATDATAGTVDSNVIFQTAVAGAATTALTLTGDDGTFADALTVTNALTVTAGGATITGATTVTGAFDVVTASTEAVNIAATAGGANAITIGNVAQVDTLAVNADTTLAGIFTVNPTGTDAINIATNAGAANVITIGNVAQADTIALDGATTITGATGIVGTLTLSAQNIATDTTTGMKIGTATNQKLGFFNAAPVVQPTAITTGKTTLTLTNAVTDDFALSALTVSTPFGFAIEVEAETFVEVVINNQARINDIETKLKALGLLA